jgi:hypothetical protein
MERKITEARDEWIFDFKKKWDKRIKNHVAEKQNIAAEVDRMHAFAVSKLAEERNKKIAEIKTEYDDQVRAATAEKTQRKIELEHEYESKLKSFLQSNLKTPSLYDSIYTYVSEIASSWMTVAVTHEPSAPSPPKVFSDNMVKGIVKPYLSEPGVAEPGAAEVDSQWSQNKVTPPPYALVCESHDLP